MGMGRGVPEADAMKSIGGALAIAILLAVVGPGIDIPNHSSEAAQADARLVEDGEARRLEIEARAKCDRLGSINTAVIVDRDGTTHCADKRGRILKQTATNH